MSCIDGVCFSSCVRLHVKLNVCVCVCMSNVCRSYMITRKDRLYMNISRMQQSKVSMPCLWLLLHVQYRYYIRQGTHVSLLAL